MLNCLYGVEFSPVYNE